jgi:hypothetical protein
MPIQPATPFALESVLKGGSLTDMLQNFAKMRMDQRELDRRFAADQAKDAYFRSKMELEEQKQSQREKAQQAEYLFKNVPGVLEERAAGSPTIARMRARMLGVAVPGFGMRELPAEGPGPQRPVEPLVPLVERPAPLDLAKQQRETALAAMRMSGMGPAAEAIAQADAERAREAQVNQQTLEALGGAAGTDPFAPGPAEPLLTPEEQRAQVSQWQARMEAFPGQRAAYEAAMKEREATAPIEMRFPGQEPVVVQPEELKAARTAKLEETATRWLSGMQPTFDAILQDAQAEAAAARTDQEKLDAGTRLAAARSLYAQSQLIASQIRAGYSVQKASTDLNKLAAIVSKPSTSTSFEQKKELVRLGASLYNAPKWAALEEAKRTHAVGEGIRWDAQDEQFAQNLLKNVDYKGDYATIKNARDSLSALRSVTSGGDIVALTRFAKAANGPGILTDKDFSRFSRIGGIEMRADNFISQELWGVISPEKREELLNEVQRTIEEKEAGTRQGYRMLKRRLTQSDGTLRPGSAAILESYYGPQADIEAPPGEGERPNVLPNLPPLAERGGGAPGRKPTKSAAKSVSDTLTRLRNQASRETDPAKKAKWEGYIRELEAK